MVEGYKGSRVLIGPPGTGKSWFLADRVPKIVTLSGRPVRNDSSPVLICSLTNAAAREIGSRLPDLPSSVARTLHSHAYRSSGAQGNVINRQCVAEWNRKHPALAITPPRGRINDAVPVDIIAPRFGDEAGDELGAEYDRLRHRLVPLTEMPPRVHHFARVWEAFKQERDLVDFTDMLEQAGEAPPLGAEIIVIDEAQDLSPLGWQVVRTWFQNAEGLLAVGDPWQALYDPWAGACAATFRAQWRGAHQNAILSQSYRVPAQVHRIAVRFARELSYFEPVEYYPRREAGPDSPFVEGKVTRCAATWTDPQVAIDRGLELAASGKRVLFLFSANYMTRPLCQALREQAVLFTNPWRQNEPAWNPVRTGLRAAVESLLDPGSRWNTRGLHDWTGPLRTTGLLRRGARKQIEHLAESVRPITREEQTRWFEPEALEEARSLLTQGRVRPTLDWWLRRLLSKYRDAAHYIASVVKRHGPDAFRELPLLHPSTIHAAKGGEADHVFLFPDISLLADEAWCAGGRFRDPVVRAFYVGITRARECLHLCEPATRRFVELPR